jgi:hypothetical protein
MAAAEEPLSVSSVEADEIRTLLPRLNDVRRAERHMARARLRRIGYPSATAPSVADFDALVGAGEILIDQTGRARIEQHPSGRIFRVSAGVRGWPVEEDWSAFDERFHWFGEQPQNVASGDHLFVFAVARWRSAVVGLYETVSAGAQRLPDSPDPNRWPWALGVRPLGAIPPPEAQKVEGQNGPQNPQPVRVYDRSAWPLLYQALAASPPPLGPITAEQRVQEVDWTELGDDVLQAVHELGRDAHAPAVIERAVEIGEWTEKELAARAWYTGGEDASHVRNVVRRALRYEQDVTRRIGRTYGAGAYRILGGYEPSATGFGVAYRLAADREPTQPDDVPLQFDLTKLEGATARHMELQDRLAVSLRERGIEPRSPAPSQPLFDLAFEHAGCRYVVEVKSGLPVTSQQIRLGISQILEYAYVLQDPSDDVIPVLLVEGVPPAPWTELAAQLRVHVIRADALDTALDNLTRRTR